MKLFDWCYYTFFKTIVYWGAKIYFRTRYDNRNVIPRSGKLVIIANHQSFLDPPLIGVGLPRPGFYMARETLFKGFWGWHLRKVHAYPVSQDSRAVSGIKETLRLLKQENAVLMFPEGTRSNDGSLGEFHRGIISIARRSKAPILPCVIQGAYEAWPRQAKLPKPKHIRITFGELIPAEKVQDMSEEELLIFLRDTISSMLLNSQESTD